MLTFPRVGWFEGGRKGLRHKLHLFLEEGPLMCRVYLVGFVWREFKMGLSCGLSSFTKSEKILNL